MTQRSFKTKASSRVTQREFVMLAVLLIAIEAFVLIQYLVIPQWKSYADIKSINDLRQESVDRMKADFAKLATFKESLAKVTQEADTVKSQLPTYVSQEEILLLLESKSMDSGSQVKLISFADPVAVASDTYLTQVPGQAANSQAPVDGSQSVSTGMTKEGFTTPLVVTQTISVTYDGQYEEIINFFKSIETNLRKVYIDQVSLTSLEDGTIGGTMNLSFVSYVDANNFESYQFDLERNLGKSNPFAPYSGFGVEKPVIVVAEPDPNIYVYLNSYLDNAQKVIVGEYQNIDSELNFNENGQAKIKLILTGDENSFNYTMSMNGQVSKSKSPVTIKNGAIQIKVLSLDRKDASDAVSILLDVDNQSSAKAVVKVLYDDPSKPRVKIGAVSNNVTIK